MRTPVASKNALATAAATGASAGSPEPVVREPGPAGSGTSVRERPWMNTFGASLKRSIGYVTQSRLVTCFELKVTSSVTARERPWTAAPCSLFSLPSGYAIRPASPATQRFLATILPVFLLTVMSATQHDIVFE